MRRPALSILTATFLGFGLSILMNLDEPASAADSPAKTTASTPPDTVPELVTSIEGIDEYKLANGVRVLLFPDSSKPTVTVAMTVFVGSRHEGYGEAGMAHLLEHMLFKGTPNHPDIPKILTERGAIFNGTTWLDRTNYYETLPAVGDNLEFAIRLEADRMVNSFVKGEDLKSEMSVVRNEFERGENSPSRVLSQKMTAAAFEWHNYGQSTIGNRADIERVPIENLQRFYRKYYQPDNAMLVIAGKFDTDEALELSQKYFGSIPVPERELDKTYTEEPAQDGERLVTLRRVGEVGIAGVMYHIPSGGHPDYPAIDILEGIMTQSPSGRLYKSLVETQRAASVSGAAYALHDPGMLRFMAEAAEGNEPDAILQVMLDTIEEVREKGVTDEEVDRIRQKFLKYREQTARDTQRLAIELSEWAAMGDWRLYFIYRDRLEKVTADDVNRVAKTYLERSNRTVGLFIPTESAQRVSVPPTPKLAEMIGDYKGREVVAAGEDFDTSPENIEKRTRRLTIGKDLKVALLPKKTRGEAVRLRLTLRYGNAENLSGKVKACELLPTLMLRGTKELSRQEIQDKLDQYVSSIGGSGDAGMMTFTVETDRARLPKVLELLQQILREPTLPENELKLILQAQIAGYEKQLNDPQAQSTVAVRRHITPWPENDPRYIPTPKEQLARLKEVTREQFEELYNEYVGASHGELAIVGDFDADETLATMTQILGGWDAKKDYERLEARVDDSVSGGYKEILTPDKANAVYFSGLAIPMADDHPDYPAMVLANFILGGGSLSSRLGDRVRQKDGLSYGVGSGFNASELDQRAAFYTYAIYNPENLEKVKVAIREELDKFIKDGVTDEELQAAQQGYLQKQDVSRSSDSTLAALLTSSAHAGRTMEYFTKLEESIEAVTTDDVRETFKKYVSPDALFTAVAGDFKKDADK